VIEDTHHDPIVDQIKDIMAAQAARSMERLRIGTLKSGTTVYRANGSARTDINTPVSGAKLKIISRYLNAQYGRKWTRLLPAGQGFNTEPIQPCWPALCHTDLEADIRAMPGFVPYEQYADSGAALPGEIGKVLDYRFCLSPEIDPWADSGGAYTASGTTMLSTSSALADIYPIIIIAPDSACTTPLRGKGAITPIVFAAGKPSKSDPMGLVGKCAWKTWYGGGILYQPHLVRLEVACTAAPE